MTQIHDENADVQKETNLKSDFKRSHDNPLKFAYIVYCYIFAAVVLMVDHSKVKVDLGRF